MGVRHLSQLYNRTLSMLSSPTSSRRGRSLPWRSKPILTNSWAPLRAKWRNWTSSITSKSNNLRNRWRTCSPFPLAAVRVSKSQEAKVTSLSIQSVNLNFLRTKKIVRELVLYHHNLTTHSWCWTNLAKALSSFQIHYNFSTQSKYRGSSRKRSFLTTRR